MKRKRDDKGKFVTHVPGPEPNPAVRGLGEIPKECINTIRENEYDKYYPGGTPTAADLDRHQANVEAENQARMDTEHKQAESAAGAQWNPPPWYSLKDVDDGQREGEWHPTGLAYEGDPRTPYGGIALFSASLAILAILGTLWAVYYVLRPKLDNFKINVTVQVPEKPAETLTLKDPVVQNSTPNPKGDIQAEHPGIGGVEGIDNRDHLLVVTAIDDVWIKVSVNEHPSDTRVLKKGTSAGVQMFYPDMVSVRAGKPDALKIKLDGKEIHPENKYHGGGNLAEYVLDGKELLAGK